MTTTKITVQYAHCLRATAGQLDVAPWTEYEKRDVALFLHSEPNFDEGVTDYWITDGMRVVGDCADSRDEAIFDAELRLMTRSREQAYKAAELFVEMVTGVR